MTRHGSILWHIEREAILQALRESPSYNAAAAHLGISKRSISLKIKEYKELGFDVPESNYIKNLEHNGARRE